MQNLLSKTLFFSAACITYPLTIFAAAAFQITPFAAQPIMPFNQNHSPILQLNTIANIRQKLTDRNFRGSLNKHAFSYLKAKQAWSTQNILYDLDQRKSEVRLRMIKGWQMVATTSVKSLSDDQVISLDRTLKEGAPLSLCENFLHPIRGISIQRANKLFLRYGVMENQWICQEIRDRAEEIRTFRAAQDARLNDETESLAIGCAYFILE
jgi:hypothetical protein